MAYDSKAWNAFCDSMNRGRRGQERLRRRLNRCVESKARPAAAASIYCSEASKQAFLGELRREVA